jgi:hypothetical protein
MPPTPPRLSPAWTKPNGATAYGHKDKGDQPMTHPASDVDPLAAIRARNLLVRTIRHQLKGKRLDIRERDHELVITSPGHPERGGIHITLATGEASHRRTIWNYLGYLPGHGSTDTDKPTVDTDVIITILHGEPTTPA